MPKTTPKKVLKKSSAKRAVKKTIPKKKSLKKSSPKKVVKKTTPKKKSLKKSSAKRVVKKTTPKKNFLKKSSAKRSVKKTTPKKKSLKKSSAKKVVKKTTSKKKGRKMKGGDIGELDNDSYNNFLRGLDKKYRLMNINPADPNYPFLTDYTKNTIDVLVNILNLFFIGSRKNISKNTLTNQKIIKKALIDIDKTHERPNTYQYILNMFSARKDTPELLLLNYNFLIQLNFFIYFYNGITENMRLEENLNTKARSQQRTINREVPEGRYYSEQLDELLDKLRTQNLRTRADEIRRGVGINIETRKTEVNSAIQDAKDSIYTVKRRIYEKLTGSTSNTNDATFDSQYQKFFTDREQGYLAQKNFIERFFEDIIQTVYYQASYDKRQKSKSVSSLEFFSKNPLVKPSLQLLEDIFKKLFEKTQVVVNHSRQNVQVNQELKDVYVFDRYEFLTNIFNQNIEERVFKVLNCFKTDGTKCNMTYTSQRLDEDDEDEEEEEEEEE